MQSLAKASARDGTGSDHRRLRGKPKNDKKTVAKKGLQMELVKAGCGRRHLEMWSPAGSPESAKDTASRESPRGSCRGTTAVPGGQLQPQFVDRA